MSNKDRLLQFKVDFENQPIFKAKKQVRTEEDFDDIIGGLKLKLFGK